MPRRFFTLDVFTDIPLAGNALAVIVDAQGLGTAAMQKIAREFNLSETVFILPPEDRKHRARIRIFTPGTEMPFAGHPTVGTAVLIAQYLDHPQASGSFLFGLEENIGVVPCSVTLEAGRAGFARFGVPKLPVEVEAPAPNALIGRALGLTVDEIGFENHHPTVFSAGFPFTFVPLRDLDAARRIRLDSTAFTEAFETKAASRAFVYTRQTLDPSSAFHARMFAPKGGIPEDPATGAAVAALSGVIAKFDELTEGDHLFRVEQGYEMGRPSLIELGMTIEGVTLAKASIGGAAVLVGQGSLNV
jgi:trans-2,3-dihydro-3-hydroxyanthranilate isomerase